MKHVTSRHAAVLAIALATIPAAASAQSAAQPSADVMRAFLGPWTSGTGSQGQVAAAPLAEPGQPITTINDRRFPPALEARLTPTSKAAYLKFKEMASRVVDKEPPTPDNNCLPFAMAGETVTTGWPMMIYVTPSIVGIHMNIDNQLRLVHMNKQHPADLKPSMHGHSVGHWEGDTLVIDTIGYDERAQFTDGFIHGPGLRSVERYRVVENGQALEKTFTFTDPDALTEPYTFTRTVRRMDKPFQEYVNAQNNTLYQCPTAEAGTSYQPVR